MHSYSRLDSAAIRQIIIIIIGGGGPNLNKRASTRARQSRLPSAAASQWRADRRRRRRLTKSICLIELSAKSLHRAAAAKWPSGRRQLAAARTGARRQQSIGGLTCILTQCNSRKLSARRPQDKQARRARNTARGRAQSQPAAKTKCALDKFRGGGRAGAVFVC